MKVDAFWEVVVVKQIKSLAESFSQLFIRNIAEEMFSLIDFVAGSGRDEAHISDSYHHRIESI